MTDFVVNDRRKLTGETESLTDRQERIRGWRQDKVIGGRALILGAGALGNEVVKNLSLMGLGWMLIADFDTISRSNLSRAVFFRREDAANTRAKAEIVAERARDLNTTDNAFVGAFNGDIVWELGSGIYRRVDVVIGCLDNVEARLHANAVCWAVGTPFIDGGILGLNGTVTAVHPPHTACWECTTTAGEREQSKNRYNSCTQVMKRDLAAGRAPTVQIASSIIAGLQTQEAMKIIQRQPWNGGYMVQYFGAGKRPDFDLVTINRNPSCWCSKAEPNNSITELLLSAESSLEHLLSHLRLLGIADPIIKLPARFLIERVCRSCGAQDAIFHPTFRLSEDVQDCPHCGKAVNPDDLIGIEAIGDSEPLYSPYRERLLSLSLHALGFAPLSFIHFRDASTSSMFDHVAELTADADVVMGGQQYSTLIQRLQGE